MRFLLFACTLTIFLNSCSSDSISNRDEFLRANNLSDSSGIPTSFTDSRWKILAGDYYHLVTDVKVGKMTSCMLIVGNRKTNALVGSLSLNHFLIVGRQGEGKFASRFIVPYENLTQQDYEGSNDLTGFNAILKAIPELKNFSWRNETQNRLMSSLLMYSQLRGITALSNPEIFLDSTLTKEVRVKRILNSGHDYNVRNFLRYTPSSSDLFQEIKRKGFQMNSLVVSPFEKDKSYFSVLKDEFDFSEKSSLYIYYPFISYQYIKGEEGDHVLVYFPAVHLLQFRISYTADKMPQLRRRSVYVSLMDGTVTRFNN
jgi:hypothetical protein